MVFIIKYKRLSTAFAFIYLFSTSLSLLTKAKLVVYKKENDPKVKERLLLIIRVREEGQVHFHVVKEMHRSNPWALDWLKRI